MGAVQAMGPGTGSGMVTVHASYASWLVTSTLWLLSYTKFTVSPETRREVYWIELQRFSQSRRRPLLGSSPGWKCPLALSHLRHYAKRQLTPVQVDVKLCLTWRHAQLVLRHAVDPLHIVAGTVAAGNQAGCKKSQDANYIHLKLFSFHTKCKDNAFHLLCLILYNKYKMLWRLSS